MHQTPPKFLVEITLERNHATSVVQLHFEDEFEMKTAHEIIIDKWATDADEPVLVKHERGHAVFFPSEIFNVKLMTFSKIATAHPSMLQLGS